MLEKEIEKRQNTCALSPNKWAGINSWMDQNYTRKWNEKRQQKENEQHEQIMDAVGINIWPEWSCLKPKSKHWGKRERRRRRTNYQVRNLKFNTINGNTPVLLYMIDENNWRRWALIHKNVCVQLIDLRQNENEAASDTIRCIIVNNKRWYGALN